MAHTAVKTPTKAAEFIIAHNRQFEEAMLQLQHAILIKTQQVFSVQYQRLTRLNTAIVNNARTYIGHHKDALVRVSATLVTKPKIMTANRQHELATTVWTLQIFKAAYVKSQQASLQHYVSVIRLMSPENVLKKGFAIVKHNGNIIADTAAVAEGDAIEVILSGKNIQSTVNSINDYDGSDFNI